MNGKAWRTVLAVAGAAVAAMLAPAAAGAASWGEELSLSGPTTPEFRAHGAGAVVDEAGNATYLWLQSIPGGFTGDAVARAQTYRADGTVSPVRNVTSPSLPGLTLGAGLGIDASGQVRVVWLQRQEQCTPVCKYAYQVETVALDGNALPVGEPVKVVERAFNDPKIDSLTFDIGPDGTMAFGFLSFGEGLEELEFLRLDPGESTPVSLEAEAEGPFEQSVEVAVGPGGEVFGAWATRDPESFFDQTVEGAFLSEEGAAQPRVLSEGVLEPGSARPVHVSVDESGTATTIFSGKGDDEERAVFVAKLDDESTLTGPTRVSASGDEARISSAGGAAARPDGTVVVGWWQAGEPYLAEIAPDGTVGEAQKLVQDTLHAEPPLVSVDADGDGFALVEVRREVGGEEAYLAEAVPFGPGATPTGPPDQLGRGAEIGELSVVSIALSEGGSAAAMWTKGTEESGGDERYEVFGSFYDGTPPAVTTMVPPKALVGTGVVMAASATDSSPITYDWDFGDGGTATGSLVTHTYATAGERTVTLTVTDSGGNSTVSQAPIEALSLTPPSPPDGQGGTQPPPPPRPLIRPMTSVRKAPKRARRSTVRVRFVSSIPGSKFECALDRKGWKRCSSPHTMRRLKPGRHRLRIRAISPEGVMQAGAAKVGFRVLKPKPRRSAHRGRRG